MFLTRLVRYHSTVLEKILAILSEEKQALNALTLNVVCFFVSAFEKSLMLVNVVVVAVVVFILYFISGNSLESSLRQGLSSGVSCLLTSILIVAVLILVLLGVFMYA